MNYITNYHIMNYYIKNYIMKKLGTIHLLLTAMIRFNKSNDSIEYFEPNVCK